MTNNSPPRGLQFVLGTEEMLFQVDTITMANLGYLQLKAGPGVWKLQLRNGKSSDLYEIVAIGDNWKTWLKSASSDENHIEPSQSVKVVLRDFEGVTIFPKVQPKKICNSHRFLCTLFV